MIVSFTFLHYIALFCIFNSFRWHETDIYAERCFFLPLLTNAIKKNGGTLTSSRIYHRFCLAWLKHSVKLSVIFFSIVYLHHIMEYTVFNDWTFSWSVPFLYDERLKLLNQGRKYFMSKHTHSLCRPYRCQFRSNDRNSNEMQAQEEYEPGCRGKKISILNLYWFHALPILHWISVYYQFVSHILGDGMNCSFWLYINICREGIRKSECEE